MGLFNFFNRNNTVDNNSNELTSNLPPDIKKETFIEDKDPAEIEKSYSLNGQANGIDSIYAFLMADYESDGYNDALNNPDDSYKEDNIKLILMKLKLLIERVTTYYSDMLRELDFHISSRGRAGLIDLVEELKTRKEMVNEHMAKVNSINDELKNNTGTTQSVILSYRRGFTRGLSALTQSNILSKKL